MNLSLTPLFSGKSDPGRGHYDPRPELRLLFTSSTIPSPADLEGRENELAPPQEYINYLSSSQYHFRSGGGFAACGAGFVEHTDLPFNDAAVPDQSNAEPFDYIIITFDVRGSTTTSSSPPPTFHITGIRHS
jgi:hypothetical protein